MPQQLSEEHRQKLDSIVQRMIANQESDANIQFVVDDFKKKYSAVPGPKDTTPKTMTATPSRGSFLETLKGYLPSPRTLAGMAGGMVGGGVTIPAYFAGPE